MGNSFADQFLKAGLVDETKAKKAKKAAGRKAHEKRKAAKKQGEITDETALATQKAREEKAARDRELNLQRKQEAEKKAVTAQIRQIIEMNSVADINGDVAFNFTHDNKIKTIHITGMLQRQLTRGHLAIAVLGETFHLIPAPAAEKINQRDDSYVAYLGEQTSEQADEEEDWYKDFEVPDDLMW